MDKITLPKVSEAISDEQVEQMYMSSEFVYFRSFVESLGWDEDRYLKKYEKKSKAWVNRKKKYLIKKQTDHLAELVFHAEGQWHKDVLKTIKEYPILLDEIKDTLKKIHNRIKDDPDVKVGEMNCLVQATKTLIEAKKSSLMIDKYNISASNEFIETIDTSATKEENTTKWVIGIKSKVGDTDEIDAEELENKIRSWYDKPVSNNEDKC